MSRYTLITPLGRALCTALVVLAGACSSTPPPRPPTVAESPPEPEKIDPGPTSMESDIGGMNEEAMDLAFESLEKPVLECLEQGASRVHELGGHFKLSLRVDRTGRARWAYLSESTLGDRETEKCVLEAARAKTWPKPVGGDGLASKTFDVDARSEPVSWEAKRIRKALEQARNDVARCKRGVAGSFEVTAYVGSDGKVLAAGVAPPNERGEDVADCVVEAIRRMRFGSSGKKPAKVSFTL